MDDNRSNEITYRVSNISEFWRLFGENKLYIPAGWNLVGTRSTNEIVFQVEHDPTEIDKSLVHFFLRRSLLCAQ